MLKTPIVVIVIAWIMLLVGLLVTILSLPLFLFGGFSINYLSSLAWLSIIKGGMLIAISIGVRHLKRWSLYVYTGLTAIGGVSTIYYFATSPIKRIEDFYDLGINIAILTYFWSISKKFV